MILFRYPSILFLYIPLFLIWFFWMINSRKKIFLSETGIKLRNRLLSLNNANNFKWKRRLYLWSLVILVFSAAGPQIGTRLSSVERKGVDLVFAIDVSTSMKAEDVKPSRLEKAKFEIGQMIHRLKGDRVAFILFAGSSHLYLPLTTDYEAALLFLDAIKTDMIEIQGTSISSAITTGLSVFSDENKKYKVLILVTDGEDHEGKAVKLAENAAKSGMVIHTVGVGTQTGALIPMVDSQGIRDYKRDARGKLITSILNESILIDIAIAGNGIFVRFDNRPGNYQKITSAIDTMEKRTIKAHMYSEYEDRYQLFALLSLGLMALGILLPTKPKNAEIWKGRFVS